jgi:predicted SnoaL-like aldol condensation-catalyzing enzyme
MTRNTRLLAQSAIDQQVEVFDVFSDMAVVERRTAMLAIGSLFLGACATSRTGLSSSTAAANAKRNKANYLAAKAAYNARDLNSCLAYYASNHQIMSKPVPPGREQIRAFFEGTFAAWPDIQVVVQNVLAEEDWVFGRSLSTATPISRQIEVGFWDLHRFNNDGLIIQTWNLTDRQTYIK